MSAKKISIRVELEGKIIDDFERIKLEGAFVTNSQAIRHCINIAAQDSNFQLRDDQISLIQTYLDREDIKRSYGIYNIQNFIDRAIRRFIENIDENTKSIYNWSVRSKLFGDELEVAISFITCQNRSELEEITVDDLAKEMNKEVSWCENYLSKFVDEGILTSRVRKGQKFYHAKK